MNQTTIIFITAILVAAFIYIKDKDREPLLLIWKLLLAGIYSYLSFLVVTNLIYCIFPSLEINIDQLSNYSIKELLFHSFIMTALISELCKFLGVYKMSYNNRNFGELYDMIVYCVFTALGSILIEYNIFPKDSNILIQIITVLTHSCFGVIMGYYLGVAKINARNNRKEVEIKNMLLSIIIPTILHGIFDFCILSYNTIYRVYLFIFVIIIYFIVFKKVKELSSLKPIIKN